MFYVRSHYTLEALLPWLLAGVAAILGATLTYNAWQKSEALHQKNVNVQFQNAANIVAKNIQSRFETYTVIMRGVQGFYKSSDYITHAEFQQYIEALLIKEKLQGVQGIGYAVVVSDKDLAAHLAKVRANDLTNYQIDPAGKRPFYVPILRMEPTSDRNEDVIGLDTLTIPAAKEAMIQSLKMNDMSITSRLVLHQDRAKDDSYGFVMYLPITKPGFKPKSAFANYKDTSDDAFLHSQLPHIQGWVDVPFRMNELINGLKGEFAQSMILKIYDGAEQNLENLMYDSSTADSERSEPTASGNNAVNHTNLHATRVLNIGGRNWLLDISGLQFFYTVGHKESQPALLAATGGVLTLLLALLTFLLASRFTRVEAQFTELFNHASDGILILNKSHHLTHANSAALQMLGYDYATLVGLRYDDILSKPQTNLLDFDALLKQSVNQAPVELVHKTSRGTQFVAEVSINKLSNQRYFAVFRDLTDRLNSEAQLRLNAQVFETSIEGILIADSAFRIESANSAYLVMKGLPSDMVIAKPLQQNLFTDQTVELYLSVTSELNNFARWQGEVNGINPDGTDYAHWISISTIKDAQSKVTHYVVIVNDISRYKAAQAKISYLSYFNSLTGLPNRQLLKERTKAAMAACQKNSTTLVLILIDLDRFKVINDSLGIAVGDIVLQKLAERLTEHLHLEDTVCHEGSDEFMVMLPSTSAEQVTLLCKSLLSVLSQPIATEQQSLTVTACLGVAQYPQDGLDFEGLMQSAEAAMYRAKSRGRNNIEFFAPEMHQETSMLLQLESELREALAHNEFVLHYQPQVDTHTHEMIGLEALIRWQHPTRGMVPPIEFIPLAEETGLIVDIGIWVLNEALRQQKAWQKSGLTLVPVAINLSVIQFRQAEFYQTVVDAIKQHGIAPALLELELTESIAMEDSDFTIAILNKFHTLGVKLSIDDFGTGYSSLNYLKRFKIDKLKIDQTFVRDLSFIDTHATDVRHENQDAAIITAIIQMAKALGFKTIAEGVETPAQLAFMQAKGCDEIQGYLFSKPLPAEACITLLKSGKLTLTETT